MDDGTVGMREKYNGFITAQTSTNHYWHQAIEYVRCSTWNWIYEQKKVALWLVTLVSMFLPSLIISSLKDTDSYSCLLKISASTLLVFVVFIYNLFIWCFFYISVWCKCILLVILHFSSDVLMFSSLVESSYQSVDHCIDLCMSAILSIHWLPLTLHIFMSTVITVIACAPTFFNVIW